MNPAETRTFIQHIGELFDGDPRFRQTMQLWYFGFMVSTTAENIPMKETGQSCAEIYAETAILTTCGDVPKKRKTSAVKQFRDILSTAQEGV